MRRIEVPAGGWSTPAHEHGRGEEIFYVLAGRGLSWQAGKTAEIGPGDCIVYRARRGAHSIHALEPIDVLAFGPREYDEASASRGLGPRCSAGASSRASPERRSGAAPVHPRIGARPARAAAEPGPRPANIVNVDDVEAQPIERQRVVRVRRDLGTAAGSVTTGIKHFVVAPGKESAPLHCHSAEEEIFVILDGEGTLVLGDRDGGDARRAPDT